jgi:hypothetical protein
MIVRVVTNSGIVTAGESVLMFGKDLDSLQCRTSVGNIGDNVGEIIEVYQKPLVRVPRQRAYALEAGAQKY